jgi:RNA polymerase sigma-70 factor (ECF subfamily)
MTSRPLSRQLPPNGDDELMALYVRTGSREAFESLVHLYERELYLYLYYFLRDAQLAEDAAQATFLQLHLKCRQFEPGRRLRPWLFAIARNQAIDLGRRNRRRKMLSLRTTADGGISQGEGRSLGALRGAEDADYTTALETSEDRERTRLAVEQLPDRLKQVLVLVVYQGLKYREAARVLRIPSGTVKSRMNKAFQSLRETLASP